MRIEYLRIENFRNLRFVERKEILLDLMVLSSAERASR